MPVEYISNGFSKKCKKNCEITTNQSQNVFPDKTLHKSCYKDFLWSESMSTSNNSNKCPKLITQPH